MFCGPGGVADQRVVEKIVLCLTDELLPGFTLQGRNPSLFDGFGTIAKTGKEFFHIQLSHFILLAILRDRLAVVATETWQPATLVV